MALRDRYLTFDGVNLKEEFGLMYSSFEEELPEPKIIKIDIPAGLDLDISDSLAVMGYHNGKHTLKFLLYGATEAERLAKKQAIIAMLHGKRADYELSWDTDYTYTGRAKVSVEHKFDNADVLTIEIDRVPWKLKTTDVIDINSHPSGSYTMTGSSRYNNVNVKMLQRGSTKIGSNSAVTRETEGTYVLAEDAYGNTTVTVTVSDWLMYVDGTNLVVKSGKFSMDGSNAVIDNIPDAYVMEGTDMVFEGEQRQHSTLRFTRYEL